MTDLSHDLRISREALAAAERRADEAERALENARSDHALELERAKSYLADHLRALHEAERASLQIRDALCVALGAMQANIAYATRKDEQALAHGIRTAQAALASPIGSGWLSPEQGAEKVKAAIERCARAIEADPHGPGVEHRRFAAIIRALAAHPTEETPR